MAGAGRHVTTPDRESSAKERSLTVSGHKVYALYRASGSIFGSHMPGGTHYDGYRNGSATSLPGSPVLRATDLFCTCSST